MSPSAPARGAVEGEERRRPRGLLRRSRVESSFRFSSPPPRPGRSAPVRFSRLRAGPTRARLRPTGGRGRSGRWSDERQKVVGDRTGSSAGCVLTLFRHRRHRHGRVELQHRPRQHRAGADLFRVGRRSGRGRARRAVGRSTPSSAASGFRLVGKFAGSSPKDRSRTGAGRSRRSSSCPEQEV